MHNIRLCVLYDDLMWMFICIMVMDTYIKHENISDDNNLYNLPKRNT